MIIKSNRVDDSCRQTLDVAFQGTYSDAMLTDKNHTPQPVAGTPPLPVEWLRLQRGVTRSAVADAAKLARYYLYRIERGLLWPSPGVILRLAGALGEDPAVLLNALWRGWLIKHGLAQPEAQARDPRQGKP